MIKKRYLMILSVAVVSVLIGSMFYNYVTLADKAREPTTYKDSIKTVILSIEHAYDPTRDIYVGGLPLWTSWASEAYGVSLVTPTFVFKFNPKKTFSDITELWISAIIFVPAWGSQLHDASFEVTLNNVTTIMETKTEIRHYYLSVASLNLTNFGNRIVEGLNELRIGAWGYDLTETRRVVRTYQINIFIEYEYQAR